jgi:hypothetical protein
MTLLENSAPAPMTWAPVSEEPARTKADWRLADTDFGGTIDKQGDHYFVRDTFARYIGDFSTLATAQRRLEDHLESLLTGQRDRP